MNEENVSQNDETINPNPAPKPITDVVPAPTEVIETSEKDKNDSIIPKVAAAGDDDASKSEQDQGAVTTSAPDPDAPVQQPEKPAEAPKQEPAHDEMVGTQLSEESADPKSASTGDEVPPTPPQGAVSSVNHHHAHSPVAAIVAAILVAIGLAAITVYAYMKTQPQDNTQTTAPTSTQETQEANTDAQIDETVNAVDDALEAADEADFSESELSDENLEL